MQRRKLAAVTAALLSLSDRLTWAAGCCLLFSSGSADREGADRAEDVLWKWHVAENTVLCVCVRAGVGAVGVLAKSLFLNWNLWKVFSYVKPHMCTAVGVRPAAPPIQQHNAQPSTDVTARPADTAQSYRHVNTSEMDVLNSKTWKNPKRLAPVLLSFQCLNNASKESQQNSAQHASPTHKICGTCFTGSLTGKPAH